jgi:hypothetical protein
MIATLALGLLLAGSASGVSLLDLTEGMDLTTADGRLTFENFSAKAQGRRENRDLGLYNIVLTDDGFSVTGLGYGNTRLKISYDVIANAAFVEGASLFVTEEERGSASGWEKIGNGRRRVDGLRVKQRPNRNSDAGSFAEVSTLSIREKMKFRDHGAGEAFTRTFTTITPEPTTGLLVASGLTALAVARRRRRAA